MLGGDRGRQAGIHWFLCAPVLRGIITTLESLRLPSLVRIPLWPSTNPELLQERDLQKYSYSSARMTQYKLLQSSDTQLSSNFPQGLNNGVWQLTCSNWIQTISTYCIRLLDLLCFFQAEITPSSFSPMMFVCWKTWVVCPVESPHILWRFLKKVKTELVILQSHSWACIWRKNMIQKDTHTLLCIAAPFTMAKTRKQPKCPSTEE